MSDASSRAASPAEPSRRPEAESPVDIPEDDDAGNASDKDSDVLSEIDEDQFEDYDPALEERPVEIDENVAKTLKAAKRKRGESETVKKPKEGRRPKKRTRATEDDSGDAEEGQRRPRKARAAATERRAVTKEVVEEEQINEEDLTPEERRRRAIQRAMDDALKNPAKRRRKKDDIVGFCATFPPMENV